MTTSLSNGPRSFKQVALVSERRKMLQQPNIAVLTDYVNNLRATVTGWEFPYFDPLDGGVNADMLFLMEKPGPMTSLIDGAKGSGFISRDNDDATAEALFNFMQRACIPRTRIVLWNVIPGWNGTIKIGREERKKGLQELEKLVKLLPKLETVVLVGRQAGRAADCMRELRLSVFVSAHPSPKVRNMNKKMWDLIPEIWQEASHVRGSL